jgi:capsular exopolysaccharide synthesis family protein
MSKVYEALRQEQQDAENLGIRCSRGRAKDAVNPEPLNPELQLADEVLQALATTGAEKSSFGVELNPRVEPNPNVVPAPSVTPNGFRRLKVAYRESSRLVFQTDPDGLAAEQFRFLRRALEQKFPKGGVLLITSSAPKDGKTLTAVNLSACLADSGRPTLLLEADIRQPAVCRLLGAENGGPGIEEALAGVVYPDRVVHFVEQLSLYVAMVKEPPTDPSRLVSGKGIQKVIEWARGHFGWVVIDSPPVLPAADVAQLVTLADAVLLVVRAQSTPRDLAMRAFELLGSHLSGVILNEATIESNPYYRYLSDYRQRNAPSRRQNVPAECDTKAG